MTRAALVLAMLLAGCSAGAPREDLAKVPARTDWAQWPAGDIGEVSAVDVDRHGHVFVLHRPGRDWVEPFPKAPIAAPVVAMFDASGKLLGQWGGGQTVMPHGLSVAPDDSIWITDDQREQLLHFSHDGVLIGTVGERGVSGADLVHFGRPTDVAVEPRGLFVADGYVNSRILHITDPINQWGEPGSEDADFRIPHSVAVQGNRLVVADRENSRLKLYDLAGKLLRIVPVAGRPYAAKFLPDGRIVSVEGRDAADREGAVLRLWSGEGQLLNSLDIAPPGGATRGHDLAIGPDGTIYVADVAGRRVLTLPLSELTKD